jgi:hypothetical protein
VLVRVRSVYKEIRLYFVDSYSVTVDIVIVGGYGSVVLCGYCYRLNVVRRKGFVSLL